MKTKLENDVFNEIVKIMMKTKPATEKEMSGWTEEQRTAYISSKPLSREEAVEWIQDNVDLQKSIQKVFSNKKKYLD